MNLGIFAQTYEGITPATISIVRSKVTAEGDTAAIFALAISADGKAIGTIEIEGAIIQTPAGGKIIDYLSLIHICFDKGFSVPEALTMVPSAPDAPARASNLAF